MPTSLTFDDHLAALGAAGAHLIEHAEAAGFDAPVPTCPAWDVRALVAHQTMVHRWATAVIRGDDPDAVPNQTTIRATLDDLGAYYRDGLAALGLALRTAPADLAAMTFLNDAPPPRDFWARRQAHETTVHGVDALAASLGRAPTAAEASISPQLAVDGIDELLRGFFTRGRSKLHTGSDEVIVVTTTDAPRRWVLRVGERLTVDTGDGEDVDRAVDQRDDQDVAADPSAPRVSSVTGAAADVYLALWNRGQSADVVTAGDAAARWATTQRVRWS